METLTRSVDGRTLSEDEIARLRIYALKYQTQTAASAQKRTERVTATLERLVSAADRQKQED